MSTTNPTTPAADLSALTAEVSQTLGGYARAAHITALAAIDDAAWARQAQLMIDAQRMRVLNSLSPAALAAIASGELSVAYIAGGLNSPKPQSTTC